jgi:ABC-type glutathione transport system ATPase component
MQNTLSTIQSTSRKMFDLLQIFLFATESQRSHTTTIQSSHQQQQYNQVNTQDDIATSSHGLMMTTRSPFRIDDGEDDVEEGLSGEEKSLARVRYSIRINSSAYGGASKEIRKHKLLSIREMNLLSGEKPLFSSDGLNIHIHRGERITLEGPSGIGKTRLLRAIADLDTSLSGYCVLLDQFTTNLEKSGRIRAEANGMITSSVARYAPWSTPQWRRQVIYVPQVSKCVIRTESLKFTEFVVIR